MNLIQIVKLIPLRNETGEIYKWHEEPNLLSPLQVARVRFEPNMDHVIVHLTNTEQIIIEDSLKAFATKFDGATR